MLVTFFLTVFVDLNSAIQIGMVLAVFLFMRRMANISVVNPILAEVEEDEEDSDPDATRKLIIPKGIKIYEITGPFFFGIAHKFKETLKDIHERPDVLIIRMRYVPTIDATGLHNLTDIIRRFQVSKTKVVLSGVQPNVYSELDKSRIAFLVGKKNICTNIREALERAREIQETEFTRKKEKHPK
jgi:SulP family sulfate permease